MLTNLQLQFLNVALLLLVEHLSHFPNNPYQKYFPHSKIEFGPSGIARSQRSWLDYLFIQVEKFSKKFDWQDYILILSRHCTDYLPEDRKKEMIKNIYKLSETLNKKLIVKLHPKELNLFEA